ncbi:hypothetical protein [Kitasatospora aureofaciens]|uniref:hypothetical protein n=1 Tax=Kitasatospora aureofaciens TaxID=1894 RepID=UPI00210AED94|nr:hypothetical protein [Kitasatospora aureofaciens]
MSSISMKRRGAFLFAAAALVTVGAMGGTAHAVPNSGSLWAGYGKSNTYASVKCVQQISNSLHYQTGYHTVDVDGSFGPDTGRSADRRGPGVEHRGHGHGPAALGGAQDQPRDVRQV